MGDALVRLVRRLSAKFSWSSVAQRQNQLDMMVAMNPDGIVSFSQKGGLDLANPAFLAMTGFTLEQLLQLSVSEFMVKMSALKPPGLPYVLDERPAFSRVQIYPLSTGGQSLRILDITVREPMANGIAQLMYFHDVTLKVQKERMKSEFLSTAAHELRTPMSSIYGYTELLLHRQFDPAATQEVLRNIHQQTADLVKMVNDLLDLAKIEACQGKEFNFLEQSLIPVVKQATEEFRLGGAGREMPIACADHHYGVYIDAIQIKRALTNVLSNALKYSPEGSPVSISLVQRTTTPGFGEVGVLVSDQGIGMTAEQITHIYERFWRARTIEHIAGTGLGMSLVKEIMDLHHGHIEIDSTPDQGTTIGLWFNAAQPHT